MQCSRCFRCVEDRFGKGDCVRDTSKPDCAVNPCAAALCPVNSRCVVRDNQAVCLPLDGCQACGRCERCEQDRDGRTRCIRQPGCSDAPDPCLNKLCPRCHHCISQNGVAACFPDKSSPQCPESKPIVLQKYVSSLSRTEM